jgi:signal transduction histidine kinase/sensor domain CHASE-containing protein
MSTPPTNTPTGSKPAKRGSTGFNALAISVIIITALLGIGLSIFAYLGLSTLNKAKSDTEFLRAVDSRMSAIQTDITTIGSDLQSVGALYQMHPDTSKKAFFAFTAPILQKHPAIQAIAWIPSVPEAEREAVEKKAREELPTFQLLERAPDAEPTTKDQFVPAQKRDQYYPIYQIEPSVENLDVVGFDLASDPVMLETINKARTTRDFALSPRITLFQGKDKDFAVALLLPVYITKPIQEGETPKEVKKFLGSVAAIIRVPELIDTSIKKLQHAFINVYVYDTSAPKEKSFLFYYDMEPWIKWPVTPTLAGVPEVEWMDNRTIHFGDRTWTLAFRADDFGVETEIATDTLAYLIQENTFIIIFGTSVLISLGLAFMVWNLIKRIKERDLHNALEDSVKQRTQELGMTIDQLKMTQAQLVAQEKLASLGSLTAGIAHELKNPLNFINNFSDLSLDLLPEISGYVDKAKDKFEAADLTGINESIGTLKNNLSSIAEQGKKANKIILTMLEHAKKTSGQFALSDIHYILDQSIEKTYQAFSETNPEINIAVDKEFDVSVGKLDLVGEDIERAFINILNNAFYAVVEKKKIAPENYTPRITVKTEKIGDKLRVIIRDNGTGIPETAKEKIFTPFFTTKPSGQGAGLGLSLSHDIIADEHSGSLTFTSVENEYTELVSTLPITQKKQKEVID